MIYFMKKLFLTITLFLMAITIFHAVETGLTGNDQQEYLNFTRHHDISMGATTLGPTAPSVVKTGAAICFAFDADAEEAGIIMEIPLEWNGASNMAFNIHWHSESGDPVQNGETVKWDIEWYANKSSENVAVDNGTAATGTATYTEAESPGVDKEHSMSSIILPYTGGNQPLEVNDRLFLRFDRDVSGDSYSGQAIVCQVEVTYTSNKLATH